jgi:general secretion pathway protein K
VAGGPRRQSGIALVVVMWALLLLATIAVAVTAVHRTETALTGNLVDQVRGRALAEAGVYYAISRLLNDSALPESERFPVDGSLQSWSFNGVDLRISVSGESGRVDLNAAQPDLLKRLLEAAGAEPEQADALAGAILDWRDTNSDAQVNGAEDSDYRAAGVLYGAKDQPFSSVEELRQVLGMTPELYRTLAPALTVYSRRSTVNPIFAPRLVLLAVLELPEAQIDEYLDAKARGEADTGQLLPTGAGSQLVQQGGDTVHRIHVEVPVRENQPFALESVAQIGRHSFQILAWELSLPVSERKPQDSGAEP